ncbi:hypothetical protein TNCV_1029871 [Trichonephila clavipes]|nr:hypothetical protein TNCV_1029871 [Trichonephila clavipes]
MKGRAANNTERRIASDYHRVKRVLWQTTKWYQLSNERAPLITNSWISGILIFVFVWEKVLRRFKGKGSASLKVLFWNAGGLTIDKFIELKTVISKEFPDAIDIAESGSSADNMRFFPLKGYKSYSLGRSRQIASRIVIFVKNDLTAEPLLKHAMTSSDSLEAIELRILMLTRQDGAMFKINPVGNLVEDFIDTNEIDFIENSTASPTFLSYRGASSRPGLLLAHPNLTPFVYRHLIQAPGGAGHKILPVIISNPGETHAPRVTKWNLKKKANWKKYASLTNTLLGNCLLDLNNDKSLDKIITTILACANV